MASPGFAVPQLPVYDPNDPSNQNNQNQYLYGIYGQTQNPTSWGTAAPNTGADVLYDTPATDVAANSSMNDVFASNRALESTVGSQLAGEEASELPYYSQEQQQYGSAAGAVLNDISQTPGFTPQQASQINVDYSQFNTPQSGYSAITGDPNAPVSNLIQNQETGTGAMLNQYQADLGGQLGAYTSNLNNATGYANTTNQATLFGAAGNVRGAESGLSSGITASEQPGFQMVNQAVDNPNLQVSNQDVQNIVTNAGTTVGNQFQTAEDQLRQQAAAQGNTSPAALAAMNQQLTTQEAETAGNEMTQAQIQAQQYQLGALQQQAGMQATAGTTEEAAAQSGATTAGLSNVGAEQQLGQEALQTEELSGQQNIAAANTLGQANLNAVNQYGQFSTNTANTMATNQLGAEQTAESEASNRALEEAQMQYSQGTGSQQLTSQGAQTVGNAQIAGRNTYLSGVTGEQQLAQQGGQNTVSAQNQTYGTETSGLNTNTANQANYAIGKPSAGDTATNGLITSIFGEGGIADKPTVARLGERGPEMVLPLGRYQSNSRDVDDEDRKLFGRAA